MKKIVLYIVSIFCAINLYAQNHVVIYRNDGTVNVFLKEEIDSIKTSQLGTDSITIHDSDYIVQEIYTQDSIYRIPLADIDSISSTLPESKLNKNVITFDNGISPYVMATQALSFTLSSKTPKQYIPKVNDIVATTFDCEAFPDGLIARIEQVEETSTGFVCTYSEATIDELYEQLFYVGYIEEPVSSTVKSPTKTTRASASTTKILWEKEFEKTWLYDGISTTFQGSDVAYMKVTITKTLTTPLSVSIDLVNDVKTSIDFQASSSFNHEPSRFQIGPVIRCGRICIPEFPLIWFEPQLSLYGYVKESGRVDLTCSAHYSRKDKFSLIYSNHTWNFYHAPITSAAVDVAEVSMSGYCEFGIQPEFMISLNSSKMGIGISSSFGLRENIDFKFDALNYFNTGVYDAIKESKATLTSPQSVSVFAQAGLFEKDAKRASFNIMERNLPIGEPRYILPSFHQLKQKDGSRSGSIIVSATMQKDLLLPVTCGLSIYDSEDQLVETYSSSVPYKSPATWTLKELAKEFPSLNPLKKYTCYPIVKFGNTEFRATPSMPIDFETKVFTGGAKNISSTKAVLQGEIRGVPPELSYSHGICYKPVSASEDSWVYVKTNQDHNDYAIEIDGLKEKEEYNYCAFLEVEGEYTYGDVRKFKSSLKKPLNVDVVMCIDCTGSMSGVISTIKRHAISFYDSFVRACEQNDIELESLTSQVVGFRDLKIGEPMQISAPYSLPAQRVSFNQFVQNLYADGGGDTPESGLEALSNAFTRLRWSGKDEKFRQVVILWTDAPYLNTMSTSSLYSQWTSMPMGKRLILFAPSGTSGSNSGSWSDFNSWPNTLRNSNLTLAFTNFDYILNVVTDELTRSIRASFIQSDEDGESVHFNPNE